jgi:hypothetical protein
LGSDARVHKCSKIFPIEKIKSHTIITTNAAPQRYLCRSTASDVSFATDAWAVGVLMGSATPADEPFAADGVSFFTECCSVGELGSSPPFLDDTSGFVSPIDDSCAAANGSWD